jgi:hypothetical protein
MTAAWAERPIPPRGPNRRMTNDSELPGGPVEEERADAEVPNMNEHQPRELAVETISCVECKVAWVDPSERWRVYLTDDDVPETVVYCHLCAEREFGGSPSHPWR